MSFSARYQFFWLVGSKLDWFIITHKRQKNILQVLWSCNIITQIYNVIPMYAPHHIFSNYLMCIKFEKCVKANVFGLLLKRDRKMFLLAINRSQLRKIGRLICASLNKTGLNTQNTLHLKYPYYYETFRKKTLHFKNGTIILTLDSMNFLINESTCNFIANWKIAQITAKVKSHII